MRSCFNVCAVAVFPYFDIPNVISNIENVVHLHVLYMELVWLSLCRVVALKSLPVYRYGVAIFTFFGPLGL